MWDLCYQRSLFRGATLKVDFWRITHFKTAMSRIVRCTFVNIVTSYLCIKKDLHNYYLHAQEIYNARFFFILQWDLNFLVQAWWRREISYVALFYIDGRLMIKFTNAHWLIFDIPA